MTPVLKPYPAYKPSGIEWLGHIPAHWAVLRIRNVVDMRVSNVDKHTKEGELPVRLCNYVDVYKNDRITEHLSFMRATATEKEIERFRLEPGDVLITKDSESWNEIGIPALVEYTADDLICGYHLALLRPQKASLDGGYLHYALQSPAVAYQFHVAANGVIRYGLSLNAIKSVHLPIPPLAEQRAIARYLGYVERRIRRYIDAKQKLVGLLEELKQATIYEAVTRGLDPDVPLKPSGVEWLGHIPAHWGKARVKYLCRFKYGDSLPANARIKGDIPVFGSNGPIGTHNSANTLSPVILIGRKGSFGKVNFSDRPCFAIDTTFYVDQHSAKADIRWLYYSLYLLRLDGFSQDSAIPGLNREFAHNQYLPKLPLPEQEAIAEYLDKETANIDTALNNTRREIELLQEYRTVLIADVVSGQVDVRDAAANLPDDDDLMADDSDAISEEVQK